MSLFNDIYDVIVIGAGHAGCEAAFASAKMGSHTLMITMNLQNVAQMSCNPAMGGIAKGQILREIDALGGMSAIVTDKTAIQFKMLNMSKGPAMWSPRAQSDRMKFSEEWRRVLEHTDNLDLYQDTVISLIIENNIIKGVKTTLGFPIHAKTVIITAGTFLNGKIHIGTKSFSGGRAGDKASTGITEDLIALGFETDRMKTGTPPRVDSRSLDFSKMIVQPGDDHPSKFSYSDSTLPLHLQKPCYITYTNTEVHNLLRTGFSRSPLFNGTIMSVGPRYCPSVEDKINRFADKERHQIFVEPEGWDTIEYYVNGFSTSLPEDVQDLALRSVPGFENVKILRFGYAIEYDYFPPTQLKHSLESKIVENLFFAGQVNGTTGYEEAAAQGLMAGINAHLKIKDEAPFVLQRNEAYIGVLIDDLITKGTEEPYRMFTSRAEFRTLLRQDNADIRLTEKSYNIGLADKFRLEAVHIKIQQTALFIKFLEETSISPDEINPLFAKYETASINQSMKMFKVFSRPQLTMDDILTFPLVQNFIENNQIKQDVIEQVAIHLKYSGYINKEQNTADKVTRLENLKIPEHFDFNKINSLSIEARQKLSKIRPTSISQAGRISGVSPSDISVLLIHLGR
ncbi:MAG: tRNA uridine-5-carboxymethylaminomethyl(34) synthesis enzyme MnmG [Flavobacteriaceae bacterium]|nr:tRNA uridine-5-carboxymethylaminomethyl(34) synthesis enzyme MnmG [Flavobacteriaceae bacterium]